ncbi:MAG: DMT family transporter [Pseudomonadota bacterium]
MRNELSLRAVLIMITGMMFIPLGDAAGKLLLQNHSVAPIFVAWARFLTGVIFIYCIYMGRGFSFGILLNWRVWLRGILITGAISSILTALQTEPLVDVFAAFFVGPIVAYFGAYIFLKEGVTKLRTVLLLIGFCGTMLVIKPTINFSVGIGFALFSGCCYGAFLVATRWLSDLCNARTLLISHLFIGTLFMSAPAMNQVPDLTDVDIIILLLWSGIASTIGNFLLVVANKMADASRLAPLVYTQLLSATVLGVVIFADYPDWIGIAGLLLLFLSGLAPLFVPERSSK